MIKVLYFARLREQLGTGEELVSTPELGTVGALVDNLRRRGGAWKDAFGSPDTVLMAVNQHLARTDTEIKDGDEVAFFPPVTGG